MRQNKVQMPVKLKNVPIAVILLVIWMMGIFLQPAAASDAKPALDRDCNPLVVNSSFETIGKDGMPEGWCVRNKNKNGTITLDKTMAAHGVFSVLLSSLAPMEGGMFFGQKISPESINRIKPGTPMKLSIKVNTGGDPGVKFMFYLERLKDGKYLKGAKSGVETDYFGWMDKSIVFDYPDDGPVSDARIWVSLMTPGNLNVDCFELAPASEEDIRAAKSAEAVKAAYVRARGLPSRHTYILPEVPRKIDLEYKLPLGEMTISLKSLDGGRIIQNWKIAAVDPGETRCASIEIPLLTEGPYKLEYTWKDGSDQDYFRIRTPQTRGAAFNAEGILLLNGEPFFPIGMYPAVEAKHMFETYGKAGINTLVLHGISSKEAKARRRYSEKLNSLGMAIIFETSCSRYSKDVENDARREAENVSAIAEIFQNVIGTTADELCWGLVPEEKIRAYYEAFFTTAPDFVVWQNHAPRLTGTGSRDSFYAVRKVSRLSDITGIDIYPVPDGNAGHNDLSEKSLACVGKYTDLASRSGFDEIPVWMILQAFSWDELNSRPVSTQPIPTYRELRFMVWNAITHGARGIFYYQPPRLAKVWFEQFGKDVADVNHELAVAAKIIARGKILKLPDAPEHVRFSAFDDGTDRLFAAVNESKEKSVTCVMPLEGRFFRSPDGSEFSGKEFTLAPYEVLILSTKPIRIQPSEMFAYNGPSTEALTIDGNWVVHPKHATTPNRKVSFKQNFTIEDIPGKVVLRCCFDDSAEFFLNGVKLQGGKGGFRVLTEIDVTKLLKRGANELSGTLFNHSGQCGVVFELKSDKTITASGEETLFSEDGRENWVEANLLGKPPVKPWMLPNEIETY